VTGDRVDEGLAVKAARGVMWVGGSQLSRQLIQVISLLALVRLLSPHDFGLLGMAMFFVGMGQLLADFGIGSAIVQARSTERVILSSCFWLNMAIAAVLSLVVVACAPLIGRLYERPELVQIVAVLSVTLLISGLQVVPSSLLYRDMRFADLARSQVLGSAAGAVFAVALAMAGGGVWALVGQPVIGSLVSLIVCMRAERFVPRLEFSWPKVMPLAKFSAALLGTNLVGYANRNADSLLIGRVLGAGPLGHYSMAIQIMLFPLQQVSSVIVRVLFPALAQIRDDLPRLRAAYLSAVASIALITFPLTAGLFMLADDFVLVVFGPAWQAMAPVLKVLAWVGMMQSVATTTGTIYLTTGRTDIAFRVTLIAAPVIIGGMAGGLPWGIQGVAIGYAIANFSIFYYSAVTAFRVVGLRLRDFHLALARPFAASLCMMAALAAVSVLSASYSPVQRLLFHIAFGALVYAIASVIINRAQLNELLRVGRILLNRDPRQVSELRA
jgi:PST family polysaccharide transporter